MNETTIAIVSAILGFIGKSLWDFFWKSKYEKQNSAHKKRMDFLERQLTEFYWPLLFQLKKNNIVWEKILNDPSDTLSEELNYKMSRDYFYPNNEKMMEIIESKYYLAQPHEELDSQIQNFIRHQAIFQGIRNSLNIDVDPIRFGEPWPNGFLEQVESYTNKLQLEYDEEVGRLKRIKNTAANNA